MGTVVVLGNDFLVGVHVDADVKRALISRRWLADGLALHDRGNAHLGGYLTGQKHDDSRGGKEPAGKTGKKGFHGFFIALRNVFARSLASVLASIDSLTSWR